MSYSPIPEHPGTPGWVPTQPPQSSPPQLDWAPPEPPDRRPGRVARALVPVLTLAVVAGGLLAVLRATDPAAGLRTALATGPRIELMTDLGDGGGWQTSQSEREPEAGLAELSAPTRTFLLADPVTAPRSGRLLVVDGSRADAKGGAVALAYQVTDRVSLLAIETPRQRLAFSPGLPMLSADLRSGVSTTWSGRITAPAAETPAAGTPAAETAATATTTTRSDDTPGCLIAEAVVSGVGPPLTLSTLWCTGDRPGWAGWRLDGVGGAPVGFERRTTPPIGVDRAADVTMVRPEPTLTGQAGRQVRFFRQVAGVLDPHEIFTASQLGRSDTVLAVADAEGTVSAFVPLKDRDAGMSDYGMIWRSRPGGSVRGLAVVGEVVVVGTTSRVVTAYANNGYVLWQVGVADAVTDVLGWGGTVVVRDASGQIQLLDGATGQARWSTAGPDLDRPPVIGGRTTGGATTTDGATLVIPAANSLRVLDLATGSARWTAPVDLRSTEVTVVGDLVALRSGTWLAARSAADGALVWSRLAPARSTLAAASDTQLMIFAPSGAEAVDRAGRSLWTAPNPNTSQRGPGGLLLAYRDHLESRAADGAVRTFPYPDGYGSPDVPPLVTSRGVLLFQRNASRSAWIEYR